MLNRHPCSVHLMLEARILLVGVSDSFQCALCIARILNGSGSGPSCGLWGPCGTVLRLRGRSRWSASCCG